MIPEILLSALLLKEQVAPKHHEPNHHIPSESPGEHTHEESPIAELTVALHVANVPPPRKSAWGQSWGNTWGVSWGGS